MAELREKMTSAALTDYSDFINDPDMSDVDKNRMKFKLESRVRTYEAQLKRHEQNLKDKSKIIFSGLIYFLMHLCY